MRKSIIVILMLSLGLTPTTALAEPAEAAPAVQQAAPVNKPHLIVSAFKVDPQPVEPGVNFTLTVDILNTSKKRVENLLVSIGAIDAATGSQGQGSGAGPTFATRSTGNSRYIGSLGAGATTKASFELAAAPKADPGLYTARIDLSYDSGGSDFSSNQAIGVTVGRPGRFEFQAVSSPSKATVGKKFPVSFEAVNAAGFTVQGVTLSLSGKGLVIEDGVAVIGALESGDSDVLEAKARVDRAGIVKADLVIKYRDDFNQEKSITKTVEISVQPKPRATVEPVDKAETGGFFQTIGRFFKALFGIG